MTASSSTATYRVDGMTCGGCARSVGNAFGKLAPEAEVSVDLAAKTVTITSLLSADQVRQVIEEAGFSFEGAV